MKSNNKTRRAFNSDGQKKEAQENSREKYPFTLGGRGGSFLPVQCCCPYLAVLSSTRNVTNAAPDKK